MGAFSWATDWYTGSGGQDKLPKGDQDIVDMYNETSIDKDQADKLLEMRSRPSIGTFQSGGHALGDPAWQNKKNKKSKYGQSGRSGGIAKSAGVERADTARESFVKTSWSKPGFSARGALSGVGAGQGGGAGLNRRRHMKGLTRDQSRSFLRDLGYNVDTERARRQAQLSYISRGKKGKLAFNKRAGETGLNSLENEGIQSADWRQRGRTGTIRGSTPGGAPGAPGAPGGAAGDPASGNLDAADGNLGIPGGPVEPGEGLSAEDEAAAATARIFDPLELLETADVSQALARRGSRLRQLTTRQKGMNAFMERTSQAREASNTATLNRQMEANARREGVAGRRESQAMAGATSALAQQGIISSDLRASLDASSRLGGKETRQRQQMIEDKNISEQRRELIGLQAQRGQFEFDTRTSIRDRNDALKQQTFQNTIATNAQNLARDQLGLQQQQVDFAEGQATAGPSEEDKLSLGILQATLTNKQISNEREYIAWMSEASGANAEEVMGTFERVGTTSGAIYKGAIEEVGRLEGFLEGNQEGGVAGMDPHDLAKKLANTIDNFLQAQNLGLSDPIVRGVRNALLRGRFEEWFLRDAGFQVSNMGEIIPPSDDNE